MSSEAGKTARVKTIDRAIEALMFTAYPTSAGKRHNVNVTEWNEDRNKRLAKLREVRRLAGAIL